MSAAISASCCAGKGGLGGARYGQIKSDAATLPVYAVTFPRSVIGIDEQRMQGIHDIVFQRPSPARFVGASLECRRPQSSRAHRGRPANLIDPLAQDASHRHEDVEIISGRGATRAALRCTIRGSATQAHREHDSHRRHSIRVVRLKGRQSLALARSRSMSVVPCVTSVVGMNVVCGRLCQRSHHGHVDACGAEPTPWLNTDRHPALRVDFLLLRQASTFAPSGM